MSVSIGFLLGSPSPAVQEPTCSLLDTLDDFSDYVTTLNSETGFNATLLRECRVQICNAVYGIGNPDISGIGVAAGYVLETALSLLLALTVIFLRQQTNPHAREACGIFTSGLRAFFDSAAYFALAIQLATNAVLARKDYGLSTADLGALEAQVAQAVAVVSLLPLLYPAALLERPNARHNERLLLLIVTVALSFYPFLSRCLHSFGEAMIGDSEGAVVSTEKWSEVERMCFTDGLDGLRENLTYKALVGLELAASLVIYLFAFWLLAGLPSGRYHPSSEDEKIGGDGKRRKMQFAREQVNRWFSERPVFAAVPLLVIVGLTAPLLWVIFHLRELQEELAESTDMTYGGNAWGFGQIVSIVLFLPVGVEMLYRWRFGPGFGSED